MTEIKKYNKLIVVLIVSCMINFGLSDLISNSSSASYILSIFCCFLATMVYSLIYNKKVSNFVLSKTLLAKLISFAIMFVFTVYSACFISHTCELINSFFMEKSPSYYLSVFLLIPCSFGMFYGIKTMSRYSVIIWLVLVVAICSMFIFCFNEYSVNNLFPVFGSDISSLVLNSFDFSIYGCVLVYYYCICGHNIKVKTAKRNIFKIVLSSGLISTAICLMLNMILPYQAVVYSDNALLTLSSFININFLLERSEIIVLILWISLSFITVGTFLASVCFIAEKSIGLYDKKGIVSCLIFTVYLLSVIFSKFDISSYVLNFSKYVIFALSLLIPLMAYIRKE